MFHQQRKGNRKLVLLIASAAKFEPFCTFDVWLPLFVNNFQKCEKNVYSLGFLEGVSQVTVNTPIFFFFSA